jgi:hypothetical protein
MRPGRARRIPLGLAEGLRLEVDPAAPVHVYLGTAEVEIAAHLRRLARPGVRCFDIGGHNAYYAMVLARLTGEPVVSFEFDPDGIARMTRNLALNPGVAGQVRVQQAYLADADDPAAGAARLDTLVEQLGLPWPSLLKIDVEGAEAAVLRGAPRVLDHRPALVIETHGQDVERECAELLGERGYRLRVVGQRARFREHRAAGNRWLVCEPPAA